ncbi:polyadenylate-binding protein 1-like [Neoarius graeffei]|uniref:polyadenylate-binding protein 1-like n=1 Tax=Neoarius graeffei TaxID=443677 RepID=UPI00298C8467|nr:polyadenylate-binding protein 1-like [Neoarius graeffei]
MNPNSMMAALYVGDLHPDVTEVMLLEMLSPAGPIRSIRLCRDRDTGSSLGYAYVNFQHRADAEQAMKMFNFELLMGRPIRIMWSQRDPSMRKTGIGNLVIKNLDKSIDSGSLYDLFSVFGKVLSCKVVEDENGSKGYAYVHFESMEAAELAKKKLNGKLLNDRKVFIEHFKVREQREAEVGSCSHPFNIYIKNLGDDVDDNQLNTIFSKFGPVVNARVVTDESGKSKGFGFVSFQRHKDAQRALAEMNGQMLNGRQVFVGRAQTKADRQAELKQKFERVSRDPSMRKTGIGNLVIKNLDKSIDSGSLFDLFSVFGKVLSCKVVEDENGSKGYAYVHFESMEAAELALTEMNGKMLGGKRVFVGQAQTKAERQAELKQKFEWQEHQNYQKMFVFSVSQRLSVVSIGMTVGGTSWVIGASELS